MNEQLNTFEEYAVIDLGSNSFHMAIARYVNNSIQIVYKQKQQVQLALGLNDNNELDAECIERGIKCLTLFSERLSGFPPENIKIIATHTMRVAINRHDFLDKAFTVLPYPIEVISGQEEARLIYLGMSITESIHNTAIKAVIDIGGGSTEIAIGKGHSPFLTISRPMGCVTYLSKFFADEKITNTAFLKAYLSARQQIKNIAEKVKNNNVSVAFGASGTIKSIHNALLDIGAVDGIITAKRLSDLISYTLKFETINEIDYPSLSSDRKKLFIGGLAILSSIFDAFSLQELHYTQSALREGVLHELIGDKKSNDIRKNTAESLSKAYDIDTAHANRVSKLAKNLLKQWSKHAAVKIDSNLASLFYRATQLHEIGLNINLSSIHKHSSYILQNSHLPGFNEEQQLLLAMLVRYHRKSLNLQNFPYFSLFDNKIVFALLQILRLSVLINNQRTSEIDPRMFNLRTTEDNYNVMVLEIPEKFAEQNQLIMLDLEQEQKYWQTVKNWDLIVTIINTEAI